MSPLHADHRSSPSPVAAATPDARRTLRVRALLAPLGRWRDALLDFALPGACVHCSRPLGRAQGPACGHCWSRVAPIAPPCCERCGHPPRRDAAADAPCHWCPVLPPWVRAVRSAAWVRHGSTASALIHALKYDGWHALADDMAGRIARLAWPRDVVRERRWLVPVPLTPWKERERGFNQAAALADGLARRWDVPVLPALRRTRSPASQTRLTPGERQVNVTGAFTVDPAVRPSLAGTHVVLVDDVVTTAATLLACAAALVDGGARIVSCATFGRAPAPGDRLHPSE
jgi:ComF family protein